MTKFQASREAHARWTTPGITSTDRVGWVKLRQKKVVNRCEVGWYVRGGPGVAVEVVTEGRGPTWEAAFADADARVSKPGSVHE